MLAINLARMNGEYRSNCPHTKARVYKSQLAQKQPKIWCANRGVWIGRVDSSIERMHALTGNHIKYNSVSQ